MDASWLTASSATSATDARFGFDTPSGPLLTGAGLQKVYALLRKTAGAGTPTINLALWENGSAVSTLLTGTSITSTIGQIVEASFNASLLADLTGAGVEIRIVSTATANNTVEIGAVEWVATVSVLLDSGSVALTSSDLLAAVAVTLDTDAITVAGSDLTAAVKPLLDTGAITAAGNDLTAAVVVTLDAGAVTTAGSDLAVYVASSVTLDTRALTVAGNDLTAAASVLLDSANVALAGADITILTASSVTLDSGAVVLAGTDLTAASVVTLDVGAPVVAGGDLGTYVASSVTLDVGTLAAAGGDITPLGAGATLLDNGAITLTGVDLTAAVAVTLDAGAAALVGNDLIPGSSRALDTGAVAVASSDLSAAVSVTLDAAAVTVVGGDVTPLGAGAILLDSGAVTIVGANLATALSVQLDTASVAVAGADLAVIAAAALTLDAGAVALIGANLVIFTGAAPVQVGTTAALADLDDDSDAALADLDDDSDASLADLYAPALIIGAAPGFASAGAGVASNVQFGSIAPLAPGVAAGDLLLWVGVVLDSSPVSAVTAPSGFTSLLGNPYGTNVAAYAPRVHLFQKIANSTEGGNPQPSSFFLASGNSALRSVNARVFKISALDGVSGLEAIVTVEGVTSLGDTDLHCPTVDPDGINRLGVLINVVGSAGGVIANAVGETGGDWTQATAAHTSTLGGDCTIDLQTAALTSGAPISGGVVPYGVPGAPWISIGLAIVPGLLHLEGQQVTAGLVMDAEI